MMKYQTSNNPDKAEISSRLRSFNLPSSAVKYARSFSGASSNTWGTELTWDTIFSQESILPKDIRGNISIDMLNEILNVGEVGVRTENIVKILKHVVAPESILGKTSIGKILQSAFGPLSENSDPSVLSAFFKFAGQDIISTDLFEEDLKEMDLVKSLSEIVKTVTDLIEKGNVRGIGFTHDLQISTTQGIPLSLSASGILTYSLKGDITENENRRSINISPSVSSHFKHSVGFTFIPSIKMETNTTLYSSGNMQLTTSVEQGKLVSLEIAAPKTINNIEIQTQSFMRKDMPDNTVSYLPLAPTNPRTKSQKCVNVIADYKFCYDYDISNISQDNNYPLVPASRASLFFLQDSRMKKIEIEMSESDASPKYSIRCTIPETNTVILSSSITKEVTQTASKITIESEYMQKKNIVAIEYEKTPLILVVSIGLNSGVSEVSKNLMNVFYSRLYFD